MRKGGNQYAHTTKTGNSRFLKIEIFFSSNLTSAYRQQYGSMNPVGIIAPAIVAMFISTLTAAVYCKGKDRRRRVLGLSVLVSFL